MNAAYDVVPVTIVTGFLGSGKSTLIADVLRGEAARDTAVLVNEFGEVGLDHLLIGEVEAQTVLLDNGCLCCSIRGELKDALVDLFSRRARGAVSAFSRVVIETTGLAMPAPIVATLLADPIVRSHYTLCATVTVVDALHAKTQGDRHPEWLAQIVAADRVLISKTDLCDEPALRAVRERIQALNPAASIATRESFDNDAALLAWLAESADPLDLLRRLGRGESSMAALPGMAPPAPARFGRGGLAHRRDAEPAGIRAFCLDFDAPLDWPVFTLWFTLLLNRHGDSILRVKGVLALAGASRPVVLHAVQHLVHPVLHLDAWPADERVSRLVFIVDGLSRDAFDASYHRFRLALSEPRQ
jgi:G3E family GTPase